MSTHNSSDSLQGGPGVDLIFVLAGRPDRKVFGLQLYRGGLAPKILLSTGRFEVRAFARLQLPGAERLREMARSLPPEHRHFLVEFKGADIEIQPILRGRFGTLGEVRALAAWLEQHPEIRSLGVVSSRSHLPRVILCCRALISGRRVRFIAAPATSPNGFAPQPVMRRVLQVATELFKLPLYLVLLMLRRIGLGGL